MCSSLVRFHGASAETSLVLSSLSISPSLPLNHTSLGPPEQMHTPTTDSPPKCRTIECAIDQALGLMCHSDMGGLKMEWEGQVHWPLAGLRGSSKLEENSLHYSPCVALWSLCPLSLTCWIKLEFLKASIIIKSLPLSYNIDLRIIFPTVLPPPQRPQLFLTLPCPPLCLFCHGYEATGHWKFMLQWHLRAKVEVTEDQGTGAHKDMLDSTGRPLSPSFSVHHGLPVLRVRSIWQTGWEWKWSSITVTHRKKKWQ